MSKLHEQVSDGDEMDRIVVLMFDAMHIRPHLEYNVFSDSVSGVVHMDKETRSGEVAQSLLVFMLRCTVICDQEPSHVSMFREAGVATNAPYILCPGSGRKVFVIFDPPHLLKSTRNNLMTSDFLVSFDL